ncbi:hypothetical protein [Verrucomicrobium sp. BvORR106]|uniref:hypothetical protein n=1 Tax=Verrucomicrobium sp. BvORR106 TaxID=1403819 RepID=UPI000570C9E0|nr:hypothetical protein [Verrucomicrobium sp. BvORR106]
MSFTFAPLRLLILLVCLGAFYAFGGFDVPIPPEEGYHVPAKVKQAWLRCVLMFVVGAVSVSLVDHHVGLFEPTNLRIIYVIIGLVLMIGAGLWLNALKTAVAGGG